MRLARFTAIIAWSVLAVLLSLAPAVAEKRVALVIGNGAYKNASKLNNPTNDAKAISGMLQSAGFDEVALHENLGIRELRRAISDFAGMARDADTAVVYYSGHGIEVNGINYLIPIDAVLDQDIDVPYETYSLDNLVQVLEPARRLRLVMLDACRDNPFVRSMKRTVGGRAVNRGLAPVEPTSVNTLIGYAAKAGSVALDGDGANSPYVIALLNNLATPGLDLRIAFGRVRDDVLKTTRNKQEPFVYGSLGGSIISLVSGSAPDVGIKQPDSANFELVFWDSIKNEKNPQLFEAYLKRYPTGAFADIAKINLQQQKSAALQSTVDHPGDKIALSDPRGLREMRERLYELNFDPGALDGPISETDRQAIREFQQSSKQAITSDATQGLLRRLREISGLKPWGAIVYDKKTERWGMAWSEATRKAAVASARKSCGDSSSCSVEISFFGVECGVFAHSGSNWSIVARDDFQKAKATALNECRKLSKPCQIVASVCADGAERFQTAN
jgi:hypothetical protein